MFIINTLINILTMYTLLILNVAILFSSALGFCAGAISYQLSINGRSLTTIPSGGYTHFYVPPGSYTIEAYEPLNSGRYNSGLDIYAKETKFLELDPCPTGFPAMGGNILFERQSQIALKDIQKKNPNPHLTHSDLNRQF